MRRLERELECARLEYARLELWEKEHCPEKSGSEGCEGGAEGACSERADGGDGEGTGSTKSRGDVQCGTALTAMAPVVEAGDGKDGNGAEYCGASVGADGGCGVASVPESGELWADVGGSARDQKCTVP